MPYIFLEKYLSSLMINSGNQILLTLILVFFGFVVFPYTRKTRDPLITYIKNERRILRAPSGLLQVWLVSRIKEFVSHMRIVNISKYHHPILMFHNEINFFPYWIFSIWFHFLKRLTPRLTGLTSYYLSRVFRQYCILQTIPSILKLESYRLDYRKEVVVDNQSGHVMTTILDAIGVWYKSSPLGITIVNDFELKGEMKIYHATTQYIHCQVELELEVELPDIPELQQLQPMQDVEED
ncbi:hypothetical protein BT93_D0544 [Corymbia citriodora subsp. variegata]|nr:hypothetical protein BT93_D0544 [Corymbia citriodora subsp. variegata]